MSERAKENEALPKRQRDCELRKLSAQPGKALSRGKNARATKSQRETDRKSKKSINKKLN